MTAIDKKTAKRLDALKISAKSEEKAKEIVLNRLKAQDITGMESEDLDTLLDMLETFVEDDTTEQENDELAEEVMEESDEEADEDEENGDEDEEEDYEPEEVEEPEEDVKPSKNVKQSVKPAAAVKPTIKQTTAAKPVVKTNAIVNPSAKSTKEETKKVVASKGEKLNPKDNVEDRKLFKKWLKDIFPEGEFIYAFISNAGVTVKHAGKNSNRALCTIENVVKRSADSFTCNIYFLTMVKDQSLLDNLDVEYALCWSGAPFCRGIDVKEAISIISQLRDDILKDIVKIDKSLGKNREKMEESLKKTAPAKKAVSKKVEEVEEEEEEEVPVTMPKKKIKK